MSIFKRTKKFFLSGNYTQRKILLIVLATLIFIAIGVLIWQSINYYLYMLNDREKIIKAYDYDLSTMTNAELEKNITKISPSVPLKPVFYGLVISALIMLAIAFVLTVIILCNLFANRYNGDKYFRFIYYTITIAFILIFFTISVQPTKTYLVKNVTVNFEGINQVIPVKREINEISYKWFWLTFFVIFISLVIAISAKKKLGYLTKSKFLNKNSQNTKQLKARISAIEEQGY